MTNNRRRIIRDPLLRGIFYALLFEVIAAVILIGILTSF